MTWFTPKLCQYIAGEPSKDDACKCGAPVHNGGVYCEIHDRLCGGYTPAMPANSYREVGTVGLAVGRPR